MPKRRKRQMDLMQAPYVPAKPKLQVQQVSLLGLSHQLRPEPDETTWVTRDRDTGQPKVIRVVDMTDAHLWRWIRFFRKRYRDEASRVPTRNWMPLFASAS